MILYSLHIVHLGHSSWWGRAIICLWQQYSIIDLKGYFSVCMLHRLNMTCTPFCILLSSFVSAVLVHSYVKIMFHLCLKLTISMYLLYYISVDSFLSNFLHIYALLSMEFFCTNPKDTCILKVTNHKGKTS